MKQHSPETQFVVCINNEGLPVSLELFKIYQVIPDARSAEHRLLRVMDESGEDYLYPTDYFVSINLPQTAEQAMQKAVVFHSLVLEGSQSVDEVG
ncbi:MAG: hypothetical protein H8D78_01085 [Chloroflexi bacterium]|nr:hypothetical protein [Chloroflexota bacterium]